MWSALICPVWTRLVGPDLPCLDAPATCPPLSVTAGRCSGGPPGNAVPRPVGPHIQAHQPPSVAHVRVQVQRWRACLEGRGGDWADDVRLPQMNPFVPTDFSIRGQEGAEEGSAKLPAFLDRISTSAAIDADDKEDAASAASAAAGDGKDAEEGKEGKEGKEGEEEEEEEEEEEGGATGALAPPPGKVLTSWFLQDSTWKVPKVRLWPAWKCSL